jgi:hypothetical protein
MPHWLAPALRGAALQTLRIHSPVSAAIDALVQGSLVELFQAYGVAVAPKPPSVREATRKFPEISAGIGFTRDTAGGRKSGRLTVSLPSEALALMKTDPGAPQRQADWARELANQLLGRVKNRMLQFSVKLQAGVPQTLEPKLLQEQMQTASAMRVYAGRTLRGDVLVTLEGIPPESELVYVGPGTIAREGDTLFF